MCLTIKTSNIVNSQPFFFFGFKQAHQERVYQEYIATKAKERNAQLETYYEGTVGRLEAEINCILWIRCPPPLHMMKPPELNPDQALPMEC